MTEGLLIGATGAVSLLVAQLLIRPGLTVFWTLPPIAAVPRVLPLDFDYRVFAFTFAVAALTTIGFALAAALQGTRVALTTALRGEITARAGASRLRNGLVAAQVCVSLVLLIAAGTRTQSRWSRRPWRRSCGPARIRWADRFASAFHPRFGRI